MWARIFCLSILSSSNIFSCFETHSRDFLGIVDLFFYINCLHIVRFSLLNSLNSPVANRSNIQPDPQATRQIRDGEAPPRSIASSELYALPHFPVDMEAPVHRVRKPSSYHPRGFSRQRPRNINFGSNESTFASSGNMAHQVAAPSSQSATQVQCIPGNHLPQQPESYNPLGFSCSQMDYYSPDPHTGAQQPWIFASASIYPPSMASSQIPNTQRAAAQNPTMMPTPYPYSVAPPYFSDGDVSTPSHGPSIATSSLQCSIPVQQAAPDTLPANVDHFGSFFN